MTAITQSTRRSLKWFEDNKPKDADCPPWASFLLTALKGSFRTQVRLADECHKALTKGFMVLHEVEGETGELKVASVEAHGHAEANFAKLFDFAAEVKVQAVEVKEP